jgi:peptidoglycan hydrolase-like protein with peptidoglycan-binding domain
VHKASRRSGAVTVDDYDDRYGPGEESPRGRRKDLIALALAGLAVCGILINALFLQKGPHPAPIFNTRPVAAQPAPASAPKAVRTVGTELTGATALPQVRPPEPATAKIDTAPKTEASPPARSRLELIADIQKELGKRGFYDGSADGVYGPKTDAAIRDFEQSSGLKHAGEPNEQLLRAIVQSQAKAKSVTTAAAPRNDPIAELIAPSPSKRILSVQRALADFGYGQIKPSGTLDAPTQEAIKQFEQSKRMPVTGQISPRLLRELSTTTGRPLE